VTTPLRAPLRFAVLASGGGSNLQAILDRIRAGQLPARLVFAASNNSASAALEKARAAGAAA
jgi:folate-dependent phosphoribosylglycinamide formyltransferase PurN